MGSYTLVVIDMQQAFPPARDSLLQQNIRREICAAKTANTAIVMVEFVSVYPDYGTTIPILTNLVSGYDRCAVVKKTYDDGSRPIIEACSQAGYTMKNFRLVGVNINFCVLATTRGLAAKLPKSRVVVIKDACNAMLCPAPWRDFAGLDRITLEASAGSEYPKLVSYAQATNSF